MVFHTAPPHPASNARCTCIPELLGGADASQKGFGERIPAKLMLRSATCHQSFMNRERGKFSILCSHHSGGGAARANAISPGVNARQTRFEIRIHLDETLLCFDFQLRSQRWFLLSDGLDDLICSKEKFRTRNWLRRWATGPVRWA